MSGQGLWGHIFFVMLRQYSISSLKSSKNLLNLVCWESHVSELYYSDSDSLTEMSEKQAGISKIFVEDTLSSVVPMKKMDGYLLFALYFLEIYKGCPKSTAQGVWIQ